MNKEMYIIYQPIEAVKNTLPRIASPLRTAAAYWLGVETHAPIRVIRHWCRMDDVRAVRLEALVNGARKRITLYRHEPIRSWTPCPL